MNKSALRKLFISKRKTLPDSEVKKLSEKVSDNFFQYFDLDQVKALHVFLPILKQKEIDTWPIIRRAMASQKIEIIVSRSNPDTLQMTNYKFTEETVLTNNQWGIPEPLQGEVFAENDIDMILVPLLGFDSIGHRVGYGKGFYDRFLQKCRPDAYKIGLSLFPPIPAITDIDPFDVKLNFVVCPDQVYPFP